LRLVIALGGNALLRRGERLASEHAPVTETWSFSGKSHGWLLRLAHRKKALVYLVPCPGAFVASCALSDEACHSLKLAG